MHGSRSNCVFFRAEDLPADPHVRDRLLLHAIGSPDVYGNQIDGMGGGSFSTGKVVSGCAQTIRTATSTTCSGRSRSAAPSSADPASGIWQANIGKRILAQVPVCAGQVVESGDFMLDGVAFPGAEIRLEFLDPGGSENANSPMLPTGRVLDTLDVPSVGSLSATLINAGNPTVFARAAPLLHLTGTELPAQR